jgi:hypothetical protein
MSFRFFSIFGVGFIISACDSSDKVLSVTWAPPEVVIQEPSDGASFYIGESVRFKALVQVSEDTDILDLSHQWSSGEQTVCEPESVLEDGFAFCEWEFPTTGSHTMTVSVSGSSYGVAQATIEVQIGENEAPTITILSPQVDELYASDELIVFEALVTDVEEPTENLLIDVSSNIDGDLEIDGYASSSGEYSAGTSLTSGQHLITMVVEDSYGKTDQDTVTFRVYDHGPPSADGVSISPASPITSDTLVATATGWQDNDNSPELYRYRWFVEDENGAMIEEPNEITQSFPYSRTTKGDLIQVEVTPYNEFGEGSPLLSSVVVIENSPPSQPSVTIDPTSPQPENNLECIPSNTSDLDGDLISFEYSWLLNGVNIGETSSVLLSSMTSHGEVWTCAVIANDGEDDSIQASTSVTISDTVAPNPPIIDSLDPYRNDSNVTLTGTCEAGCAMIMYCSDPSYSWTDTLACDSSGNFSYQTSFSIGSSSSCYATCEDAVGNISGNSNVTTSEICSPTDVYESTGLGDTSSASIDQWSAVPDDGSSVIIIGNILENDTDDWYVISSFDDIADDLSVGIDYYRVNIDITDGSSDYSISVYKGGVDATDLECQGGYTSYSDFNEDNGEGILDDGSNKGIPTDTRACGSNSSTLNECEDNSTDYYIHVFRNTPVNSCQAYELTITNGVW